MTWADATVAVIIAALLSLAAYKIIKAKKSGAKCAACTGCPYNGECTKHKN